MRRRNTKSVWEPVLLVVNRRGKIAAEAVFGTDRRRNEGGGAADSVQIPAGSFVIAFVY